MSKRIEPISLCCTVCKVTGQQGTITVSSISKVCHRLCLPEGWTYNTVRKLDYWMIEFKCPNCSAIKPIEPPLAKFAGSLTGMAGGVIRESLPTYPPTCQICKKALTRANMVGVGFDPCPEHPHAPPVYHLQEGKDGYPAGWALCSCGKPVMEGRTTCYICHMRAKIPPGQVSPM